MKELSPKNLKYLISSIILFLGFFTVVFSSHATFDYYNRQFFYSVVSNNQPPIVNAGADGSIASPQTSLMNYNGGTASDPGGTVVSSIWSLHPSSPPATVSSTYGTPTNPIVDFSGMTGPVGTVYTFRLTSWDDEGLSSFDDMSITIAPPFPGIDLIAGPSSPTTAIVGQAVNFSALITNQGDSETRFNFQNFFQIDNEMFDPIDLPPTAMNPLAGGSSSITISPSYTFSSAGTYYVRACANKSSSATRLPPGTGGFTESDWTNNCANWRQIIVTNPTLPDLTASAPSPTVATVGVPLTFTGNVHNIGTNTTGSSFYNFFQLSTSPNGGSPVFTAISANNMSALAGGASAVATSSSYTFTIAGTYSVRLCADKNMSMTETILESDENNNCSSWVNVEVSSKNPLYTVDLKANGSDDPPPVYPGSIVTLSWEVNPSPANWCSGTWNPSPSSSGGSTNIVINSETTFGITCDWGSNRQHSDWVTVKVSLDVPPSGMSGTIDPEISSCTIALGQSTCSQILTWSTVNPVGTSAVTSNHGTPSPVNGNSGSQSFTVPYNNPTGTEFYLYNNGILLDQAVIYSDCVAHAYWDGSRCVSAPQIPQIIYFEADPSAINLGESSRISWVSINTNYCTSDFFPDGGATSGSESVTPGILPITYTIRCFNNSGQFALDQLTIGDKSKKKPIFIEQ